MTGIRAVALILIGAFAAMPNPAKTADATQAALPAPSADPTNIEGVWMRPPDVYDPKAMKEHGSTKAPPPLPPMTEAASALFAAQEAARKAGRPELDPSTACAPLGITRLPYLVYPVDIIQTPGLITMIFENNRSIRFIHMDSRHPAHIRPTWEGNSIGHWEGDTLVVDTIGQRPDTKLYPSLPVTEKTRVTERWRKIDDGRTLEYVWTIEDPAYYTAPWSQRTLLAWTPGKLDRVGEFVCEEGTHPEGNYTPDK